MITNADSRDSSTAQDYFSRVPRPLLRPQTYKKPVQRKRFKIDARWRSGVVCNRLQMQVPNCLFRKGSVYKALNIHSVMPLGGKS